MAPTPGFSSTLQRMIARRAGLDHVRRRVAPTQNTRPSNVVERRRCSISAQGHLVDVERVARLHVDLAI
jgi:hypothetical protein